MFLVTAVTTAADVSGGGGRGRDGNCTWPPRRTAGPRPSDTILP